MDPREEISVLDSTTFICFFKKLFSSFFISFCGACGINSEILYGAAGAFDDWITLNMFWYFWVGEFTKSFIFGTVKVDLKNSIK